MNQSERDLMESVRGAEGTMAREYGEFILFGLFQTEETAGKWDVVVSAPWLTTNRMGIQRVVDGLSAFLAPGNWSQIGGVVPLPPDSEFVRTAARIFRVEHKVSETSSFNIGDVQVIRAVVITAGKEAGGLAERPFSTSPMAMA